MGVKLKRYHMDVYCPEWYNDSILYFTKNLEGRKLILSYHAVNKYKMLSRQYKKLIKNIIETVNLEDSTSLVFEFYATNENEIKKVCFRFPTEVESDIILVISSTGKVVTIFLNRGFDPHITLDRNLYEQPKGEIENVI